MCRALNDLCQQHGWSESPVFSCVAVFDLDDEERMHQRAALAKLREMAQGKTPVYDNPLGAFLVRCHRECLAMDAAAQSEPKAQGERQGPSAGKSGLSKEALAIAALKDHPEWSDAEIAKAAGCNRTSLYRMPDFLKARQILRQGKANIPKGSKNAEDGTLEAWDGEDT